MAGWTRKVKSLAKLATDKDFRFIWQAKRGKFDDMPDDEYLKRLFKARLGYDLNLDDPKCFNEKIQWIKLNDRNPVYTTMADKYEAKKFVADKIGEQYIVPLYGVWDSFDEIDFDKLPDQFVLKATHDSGGLIICRNKKELDLEAAREKLERSLKRKYGMYGREWVYLDIKPRIIAEKYIQDNDKAEGLTDYKFFCFNEEPLFLLVSTGLENRKTARRGYLNIDWTFSELDRPGYTHFEELPPKPENYSDMIRIARILSEGTKFLRVDLYEIEGQVYFGELTFYPSAGLLPFYPEKYDRILGDLIDLNK